MISPRKLIEPGKLKLPKINNNSIPLTIELIKKKVSIYLE